MCSGEYGGVLRVSRGCPALLAFLARGRGFLADIAAADCPIDAKLLAATGSS